MKRWLRNRGLLRVVGPDGAAVGCGAERGSYGPPAKLADSICMARVCFGGVRRVDVKVSFFTTGPRVRENGCPLPNGCRSFPSRVGWRCSAGKRSGWSEESLTMFPSWTRAGSVTDRSTNQAWMLLGLLPGSYELPVHAEIV